MHISERLDDHQKFKELAILAQRGAISEIERLELSNHLRVCRDCRQVSDEYSLICAAGMPFLAATLDQDREAEEWDSQPARNRLMSRVRRIEKFEPQRETVGFRAACPRLWLQNAAARWGITALAACVLAAVAVTIYWMGARKRMTEQQNWSAPPPGLRNIAADRAAKDELIAIQNDHLSHLQSELTKEQHEVLRLREALQAAENHSATTAVDAKSEEQLRDVAAERDKLAGQLRDAEQSYQLLQAELTSLRADHEKTMLRTTSLQMRVEELEASARDEERRLKDDEQYLSSDRDIRELMGARKLYIADVFDVDSGSRTRKPFGRVFYTQNKSLIFYAFDLDRQPGVKSASAFQVWGQSDGAEEQNHATNLGILYMDSESNRRWVLKIDDPKQLAEIDAVFVTIEPHGGSQKPTGKPFLYALLRREANHP
jgi:hypothetical protein